MATSSKASGSGPQGKGVIPPDLRLSCAFCLDPPYPNEVQKCERCHRRTYCSTACKEADWKKTGGGLFVMDSIGHREGVAQGHKNWCGLPYGEEGLDWIVKEKESKGRGRKFGLLALRDLPRFFRVRVEGLKKKETGEGARGGSDFLRLLGYNYKEPHLQLTFAGVEYEDFRYLDLDHACAANAGLTMDETMKALILYATRPILAGEEIRVQLKLHNDIFHPIPSQKEFADLLRKEYGVVCPDNCCCKDKDVRAKLEELRTEVALLSKEKGKTLSLDQAKRLLQLGNEVIPLHDMPKLHGILSKRVVLGAGEEGEVLELLRPYMTEVKAFVEAVYHPSNVKRFEGSI